MIKHKIVELEIGCGHVESWRVPGVFVARSFLGRTGGVFAPSRFWADDEWSWAITIGPTDWLTVGILFQRLRCGLYLLGSVHGSFRASRTECRIATYRILHRRMKSGWRSPRLSTNRGFILKGGA